MAKVRHRWHQCDACGVPMLRSTGSTQKRCKMTPYCVGHTSVIITTDEASELLGTTVPRADGEPRAR